MRHRHDFEHDHHHHHHRPRGGGPAARFFHATDLRYVILSLIQDEPRHGYDIIKRIEAQLAGAHAPSPGIVYPTLTLLEEMGLAAVTVEGTRKLYSITEEGRRELAANQATVDALLSRMQEAGERWSRDRSSPLARAVENLRMVLRMRGERWSPDQVAQATEILDETARRLERLP